MNSAVETWIIICHRSVDWSSFLDLGTYSRSGPSSCTYYRGWSSNPYRACIDDVQHTGGLGYITTTADYYHYIIKYTKIGENFFMEFNECVELRYYHIWSLCQQQKKRMGRRIPQIMLLTRAHSDSFWVYVALVLSAIQFKLGKSINPM